MKMSFDHHFFSTFLPPKSKHTMDETEPLSHSTDAVLHTVDGEEIPLEEARKLSRNYT